MTDDVLSFVHGEDRPAVERSMGDMLSERRLSNVNKNRNLHKDGSVLHCEWYSTAICDAAGRLASVISLGLDVTERKRAQTTLRESAEHLRDAQRMAHIGSWQWTLETDAVIWSEELYHVCGLNPKLPPPRFAEMSSCYTAESWKQLNSSVTKALQTGEPYELELDMVRQDGMTRHTSTWGEVSLDATGRIVGLHGTVQDITARRRAEDGLLRNEAKQRKMVSNIGDVIVIIDQFGTNRYKSPSIEKWFGWRPEDVVGISALENVHPDDLNSAQKFIGSLMDTPNATATTECRYRCKDGSYKWIEFTGVNLLHDPDILGVLGNYHDITERKRAEDAVRVAEERFRSLLEASYDWIWEVDQSGVYTFASPKVERLLGYKQQEVIGKQPFAFMPPDEAERLIPIFAGIMARREAFYNLQNRCLHKDGHLVVVETSGIPFFDAAGNLLGYRGTDRDITERLNLEEQFRQAQKLESIGQLAGGVAHDFNNILAAMMMRLGFMQQKTRVDQEALAELTADAKRAASLTRQLLLFSRRSVMAVELLDLNELVTNALKMLSRLIGEHITMQFVRCDDLPGVEADAVMLEQVLMNLAVNARDAMPKGGLLAIKIEPVQIDEEQVKSNVKARLGQFVCLSVADTGCGMDKATLKRIFEPFFTTKEVGKGTGLGLATVDGIVAQHKGWVEVESELGKGTTFKVFLPPSTQRRAEPEQTEKMTTTRGHETILLVEDEANLRQSVVRGLQLLEYRVLEADNGQTAMKLWQEHGQQIDLLFSDMVMPEGITGLDLAEKLKAHKPNLKVIISSGYNLEMAGQGRPDAGGIVYFQKPYEFEVLSKIVRDCLDRA